MDSLTTTEMNPWAYFQGGFASDLETVWAEARREEGAYSRESVTDEQRSLSPNRPKDDGKCTLKTRPNSASLVIVLTAFLAGCASDPPRPVFRETTVHVSEVTLFGDMDCFRIETPTATYVYGKRGAGFASIIDRDGRDWIAYSPGGKARGEYRGLPKCGQPTKYFHCGYGYGQYTNDNWFRSQITLSSPAHAQIYSETRNGDSACLWDFFNDRAILTLLRIGQPTYWFLYEGAPGGELDVNNDYTIRPGPKISPLREPWSQVTRWAAFGSMKSSYALLCINHQIGSPEDSYVSWPYKPEPDGGLNQMTVFGFGRHGWTSPDQHHPALTGLPARFTVAFCPTNQTPLVAQKFSTLLLPRQ
jgi:hypothetical protein